VVNSGAVDSVVTDHAAVVDGPALTLGILRASNALARRASLVSVSRCQMFDVLGAAFTYYEKEPQMRASLIAVAVVFVALVVGCSQPISPTSPTSVPSGGPSIMSSGGNATSLIGRVAAGKEVPFKGSLEGVVTRTPLAPPFVSVLIEGTGNATQLGRFTVENAHLVNTATRTAIGSYEFTAANGDTLTADFTGQASLTETPGVLSVVETATITGGTGRFAGATGSFTVERLFDANTLLTTGSFKGTISSPGASQP
jgi:hypothetical protein